jgi:hypothetical protein
MDKMDKKETKKPERQQKTRKGKVTARACKRILPP